MGKKSPAQRTVLCICGIIFLIGGITLVLAWWDDVLVLARGATGALVAIVGLIMLYTIRE